MAPSRPFPIGAASVQYFAGFKNTTFNGLSVSAKLSDSGSLGQCGPAVSASEGARTQTQSLLSWSGFAMIN
jgi:hypothetical protein